MQKIPCGGFYIPDDAIEYQDGKPILKTGGEICWFGENFESIDDLQDPLKVAPEVKRVYQEWLNGKSVWTALSPMPLIDAHTFTTLAQDIAYELRFGTFSIDTSQNKLTVQTLTANSTGVASLAQLDLSNDQ